MGDMHLVIDYPYLNIKRLMKLGILEPFIFYKLRAEGPGHWICDTTYLCAYCGILETADTWKMVLFLKTKVRYGG